MTEAYPLQWPAGWPRTPPHERKHAPFRVTPGKAIQKTQWEVERLGGKLAVISSNVPLRRDGLPYAKTERVTDPGAAVYFMRNGKQVSFACDQYADPFDNIRAIGKTIEAMRGIERWGASDMLDRAFSGFEALPAPEQWWQVLGLSANATPAEVDAAYRRLAREAHPDTGGSDAAMARLNAARDQGRAA
jgi:hypothetical protein